MVDQQHFERDDILGNWYPTDCVVALLSTEDAKTAIEMLRQAGFESEAIRHWTSEQMLEQVEAKEDSGGIKSVFRILQRGLTDDGGALNVYEQGAKYGLDVVAVYAPNEQAREGAHKILAAHLATHIKYFGQYAVTDFS